MSGRGGGGGEGGGGGGGGGVRWVGGKEEEEAAFIWPRLVLILVRYLDAGSTVWRTHFALARNQEGGQGGGKREKTTLGVKFGGRFP